MNNYQPPPHFISQQPPPISSQQQPSPSHSFPPLGRTPSSGSVSDATDLYSFVQAHQRQQQHQHQPQHQHQQLHPQPPQLPMPPHHSHSQQGQHHYAHPPRSQLGVSSTSSLYLGNMRPHSATSSGLSSSTSAEGAGPSRGRKPVGVLGKKNVHAVKVEHGDDDKGGPRKKKPKRSTGKACVYCRRSHMVCEGGRPCERCIKREIPHLCRDFTPPPHNRESRNQSPQKQERNSPIAASPPPADDLLMSQQQQQQRKQSPPPQQQPTLSQPQAQPQQAVSSSQNQINMYSDPNFPTTWPLLPDATGAQLTFSEAPTGIEHQLSGNDDPDGSAMGRPAWGQKDDGELAALNKFMKDLGVPNLPNDFLAFMGQIDGDNKNMTVPNTGDEYTSTFATPANQVSGQYLQPSSLVKGKETLAQMSRIDKYLMAAADQPSGPRASRLAQVIKAKYDAGLLKPYDYVKGYERMNKWMDSGRAAPKMESRAGSESMESPQCAQPVRNGRMMSVSGMTPVPAFGKSISPDSRRRILAALAGFRPKFRQIARTLTNVDLVFVEEAMERWMLEYDRAFASIHTPSCIWRRTGEIQKANQEFSNLTGIPSTMFRDGQLCVYELMDEDSAVRYWEGYANIAFDPSQRAMSILCTLHIPISLIRHRPRHLTGAPASTPAKSATSGPPGYNVPDLALPQSMFFDGASSDAGGCGEEYREMKCCFSVTIRRDAWGVPVAIMGQWIPIQ